MEDLERRRHRRSLERDPACQGPDHRQAKASNTTPLTHGSGLTRRSNWPRSHLARRRAHAETGIAVLRIALTRRIDDPAERPWEVHVNEAMDELHRFTAERRRSGPRRRPGSGPPRTATHGTAAGDDKAAQRRVNEPLADAGHRRSKTVRHVPFRHAGCVTGFWDVPEPCRYSVLLHGRACSRNGRMWDSLRAPPGAGVRRSAALRCGRLLCVLWPSPGRASVRTEAFPR